MIPVQLSNSKCAGVCFKKISDKTELIELSAVENTAPVHMKQLTPAGRDKYTL
jgi:hypothetical protein